jgi:hypothetical protein
VNQSLQSPAQWSDYPDDGRTQPALTGGLLPAGTSRAKLTVSAIGVTPAADLSLATPLSRPTRLGARCTGRTRWQSIPAGPAVMGTRQ